MKMFNRKPNKPGNPLRVFPLLESLDDRITPSTCSTSIHSASALGGSGGSYGPATHFLVQTQEAAVVGDPSQVTVTALDASNHVVKDYTGTVAITSDDPDATDPANYTFTAKNHGTHTFEETFGTVGTETVTATDTSNSSITGTASIAVDAAPTVTHFAVFVQGPVYANEPAQVTVEALGANNHIVKGYDGTVTFSSTDTAATLPANYTFTSNDDGVHTFSVTFATTGSQSLTVTDASTSTVTNTVSLKVSPEQTATHLGVYIQGGAAVGSPVQVTVVALDAHNRPVENYTGTVEFSSTDSAATLPAAYTFTTADEGVYTFSVTFATTGKQTLTVADESDSSLTQTVSVHVSATPTRHSAWGMWFRE